MKRGVLAVLTSAVGGALAAGAIAMPASAATTVKAAASSRPGHLGAARPVPGLKALNVGGAADVSFVRCPAPGGCTAAGDYVDGRGNHQAWVASEAGFTWGNARPVPGLAAIGRGGTHITSLSCPAAGSCEVGGWFVDASGNHQAFVDQESGGKFGSARTVSRVDDQITQSMATVGALSCATPGNCTAALTLPETPHGGPPVAGPFVMTETNGKWDAPQLVPGIGAGDTTLPAVISSVSCWAPSNCVAVGRYTAALAGNGQPFVALQGHGTWTTMDSIPNIDSPLVMGYNPAASTSATQVSCWAFDACTVSGVYGDTHGGQDVFVADWTNDVWLTQTLPGSADLNAGDDAAINALSCGAAGSCAVAGQLVTEPASDPGSEHQALVDSRVGGTWDRAQEIQGISNLPGSAASAVSCPPTGSCVTGGNYIDAAGHRQAFLAYENTLTGTSDFGSFGGATQIAGSLNAGGAAGVDDISCASAGECAIGGFYTDDTGNQQGFIAEQSSASATRLTLSAAKVKLGHEQSERLSVTVTPRTSGTPTGKVTIKAGSATVCTVTLAKGRGTCTLKRSQLRPRTYHLTAAYHGSQGYTASTSASKTLTVTR